MNWLVVAEALGGTVLFLVGMQLLSSALRVAAGERMRGLLTAATRSRWRGLALGTSAGFLAHSSAATVMTVGFVNAGLLGLTAALPVLCGANVGTTLSMQLISFRLTDYALAAVAVGGALYLLAREGSGRTIGQAILGFGLLFLGMKISGEAIVPYRDSLAPLLQSIHGGSVTGMATGVVLAAAITAIVQSSGAVIGMSFVLAGSGVFTSLWQTYPIVLGAHVGTTLTAVIASLGTATDARRAALANVVFNLGNMLVGAGAAGVLIPVLQQTSSQLAHQTANAHTLVMVIGALVFLPLLRPWSALMARIVRLRGEAMQPSFLETRLLATPEDALQATIREIGRCADICVRSLRLVRDALGRSDRSRMLRPVARNEDAIDEIRTSVHAFLRAITREKLSHRQALLAQSLNRCVIEVERVGDHIGHLAEFVVGRRHGQAMAFDAETAGEVRRLLDLLAPVVERMAGSFAGTDLDFDAPSWAIMEARNAYNRECTPVKGGVTARLSRHEVPPQRALAFSQFSATCDRIVRHCAVIAQEQRQPTFALQRERLGRSGEGGADAAGPTGAA